MYIKRNDSGEITAVSVEAEGEVTELIDDDSPELVQFLDKSNSGTRQLLERSDMAMARVLEDMISLLIDKGVIQFTDLPREAQEKLLSRIDMRGQMKGVDLLDDEDILEL